MVGIEGAGVAPGLHSNERRRLLSSTPRPMFYNLSVPLPIWKFSAPFPIFQAGSPFSRLGEGGGVGDRGGRENTASRISIIMCCRQLFRVLCGEG